MNKMDKMDSSNLWSKVNVIVVSDHGMTKTDLSKVIDISDYVDMSLIERHVENGAYMFIHPVEGKIDKVVEDLKQTSHMTVYRKNEIPDRLHFKNNRRVLPVFLLADEGWSIITNKTKLPDIIDTGAHGYDNNLLSMKPIFMAAGPNIKRNHITPVFKNTDLYPRMCKLLGIQPMPNNGSLEATSSFIV